MEGDGQVAAPLGREIVDRVEPAIDRGRPAVRDQPDQDRGTTRLRTPRGHAARRARKGDSDAFELGAHRVHVRGEIPRHDADPLGHHSRLDELGGALGDLAGLRLEARSAEQHDLGRILLGRRLGRPQAERALLDPLEKGDPGVGVRRRRRIRRGIQDPAAAGGLHERLEQIRLGAGGVRVAMDPRLAGGPRPGIPAHEFARALEQPGAVHPAGPDQPGVDLERDLDHGHRALADTSGLGLADLLDDGIRVRRLEPGVEQIVDGRDRARITIVEPVERLGESALSRRRPSNQHRDERTAIPGGLPGAAYHPVGGGPQRLDLDPGDTPDARDDPLDQVLPQAPGGHHDREGARQLRGIGACGVASGLDGGEQRRLCGTRPGRTHDAYPARPARSGRRSLPGQRLAPIVHEPTAPARRMWSHRRAHRPARTGASWA